VPNALVVVAEEVHDGEPVTTEDASPLTKPLIVYPKVGFVAPNALDVLVAFTVSTAGFTVIGTVVVTFE
jgi:hypothetical protein